MEIETFWLVWREGGELPTKKHCTREGAVAEADRLLRMHPDAGFYVLQSLLTVRRSPVVEIVHHAENTGE